MVIGLDCADPEPVFGRWLADLPNIKRVLDAGVHGKLRSITPPSQASANATRSIQWPVARAV